MMELRKAPSARGALAPYGGCFRHLRRLQGSAGRERSIASPAGSEDDDRRDDRRPKRISS